MTITLPSPLLRSPRITSVVCTALLHYGGLMMAMYLAHTPDQAWQHLAAQRTVLEVSLLKQTTQTDHAQSIIDVPVPQPVKQATQQPVQKPTPQKVFPTRTPAIQEEPTIPTTTTPSVATGSPSQETPATDAPATAQTTTSSSSIDSAASHSEPVSVVSRKAQPDYAYNPPPDYPMLLRENNISGVVHIQVLVQTDGSPREINIHKSSGYRLMDEAALRAVRRWRFIPAMENGRISAGWVEFPIRFSLTNS